MTQQGFTIMELLVVVAVLSVLATVGVPMYNGHIDNSRVITVQNNLRSVYLQQQDYFIDNNAYYSTGAMCNDSGAAINTNLFSGTQILTGTEFNYCILQNMTNDFEARAEEVAGVRVFTINELNVTNF